MRLRWLELTDVRSYDHVRVDLSPGVTVFVGANGQGKTKAECLKNLSEAIDLILEDRRDDALRGLPANAMRELVAVG